MPHGDGAPSVIDPDSPHAPRREGSERLDKWLWYARFFKTRNLASRVVSEGKVRVDSVRVSKPSRAVSCGNTLTFTQAGDVRVIRILALPVRRGPAPEAQSCYEDLAPVEPRQPSTEVAERTNAPEVRPGQRKGPRPTKKNRRNLSDF